MSTPHEVFRDADQPSYYHAELSAAGVRFIGKALRALNDRDLFTQQWAEFEARCKEDLWRES